jgi:photosystem II stability/assembly factor-like uncharacterized protein
MRARAAILPALVAATVAASPASAEPGWIPLGPQANQRVVSITVVPGAPSQVYAGGASGVFRTSDGSHWELLDGGEGLPLGAAGPVCSAPTPDSPVYLATDSNRPCTTSVPGVFRSDDGGESWTRVKDVGGRLAIAPGEPSGLYLATADSIETSRDGGTTWVASTSFPFQADLQNGYGFVVGLAVAPTDPAGVFVSFEVPGDHDASDFFAFLRSDDGGGSWNVVQTGSAGGTLPVGKVILDPGDPSTAYLVAGGVYRSTDGGATWEARNGGLPTYPIFPGAESPTAVPVDALAIDPESPSTLFAALESVPGHVPGGVYRSTDAGATWTPASDGLPLPLSFRALALDPADPERVYPGTPDGVFRSLDGGGHWTPAPALPTPTSSVAIDPRTPAKLFTGTRDGRILASDDGGQAWHRIDSDIRAQYSGTLEAFDPDLLTIAPSDPSILFMGEIFTRDGDWIPRSTDGGASWQFVRTPPGDLTKLLVDPRDPNRVLAGAFKLSGGVFASDHLGGGWRRQFTGSVGILERAPSEPDVLYAGVVLSSGSYPDRVCHSTDGGGSWECSPESLPVGDRVAALAVDPQNASVVLAAVVNGDINDPSSPPVVTRIERSLDGGATWAPVNLGLTHLDVHELTSDPSGRVLVAATGGGLFRYSTAAGPPPPTEAPWIRDAALPGFRVKARIDQGSGASIPGTKAPACIPETICAAGALPDRAELFVRVVGPKPNGRLWPTLVKFSTSRIEVWIQQLSTGELRYYELAGARPGFDELPGLFDRSGFLPTT